MLDPSERQAFWEAFKSSPLFANWKKADAELSYQFDRLSVKATQPVFRAGQSADFLYLVGSGIVLQTLKHDDVVWLQREFRRGDYFGQHALFGEKHLTDAVALTDAVLYVMPASDLRTALERNPELHEILLQEKRAGRLRTVPLLRELSDADLMRLAPLLEEIEVGQGTELPLKDKPGLWIIDHGQVTVTGPAGHDLPGWRLTAGNFFLSEGVAYGGRCVALSARTHLPSMLFFLSAVHSDRLIPAFPDVGRLVAAPLNIAGVLANVALFASAGMTQEHRQHLAQFIGWEFVPDPQNVTTQGAVGHSFVILREGAGVAISLDDHGRLRPQSYLHAGQYYGETSLLQGRPRDATVRAVIARSEVGRTAVRGADVLTLDRRDLQQAFKERTDLWRLGVELFERFKHVTEEKQLYKWQAEGETVLWHGRGHYLWLLLPELATVFAALVWLLLVIPAPSELRPSLLATTPIVLGVLALVGIWFAINYYDDYYVVTNRRVTRRDRQVLLFTETVMEAPIETVQDVTVKSAFWGRLFDWGDLTVRTAAKVGAIVFGHVASPEGVKRSILEGKAQAAAVAHSQQKERFRRGLITQMRLALPIPQRRPALGEDVPMPGTGGFRRRLSRAISGRRPPARALPTRHDTLLVRAWLVITKPLPPRFRQALVGSELSKDQTMTGLIVWRKHPIALIVRAWVPFLLTILMVIAGFQLADIAALLRLSASGLLVSWLVLMSAIGIWLWWRITDYRNDIYVLTDEKIIDIEMKPLGLDYKRKEGSLERVQTITTDQSGILPRLLDYGNVIIRTAAADEGYDFLTVPSPKHVQEVVFQRMDALRQRQEARRLEERQRELVESLHVYDELRTASERAGRRML